MRRTVPDVMTREVVAVRAPTPLALKEVAPLREAHTPVFETAQRRGERAKAASLTAAELRTAPAAPVPPAEPAPLR